MSKGVAGEGKSPARFAGEELKIYLKDTIYP